jgi:signal transduction histidine kinase
MNNEQGYILVVDDDPLNLLRMSRDLQKQGHTVVTANDGPQALEMLRTESFDVVLLDIIMPEMDGRQVLKEIKQDSKLRDIPVIVISALDEVDSVVECIEKGAEDYLAKPFKPALLRARLNASLGKKKLRDLEVAYLQQEMALRQNEKLATLGKLSAGVAHELNNPAAAAQRGVAQLQEAIVKLEQAEFSLGQLNLSALQLEALEPHTQLIEQRAKEPIDLDPLTRSDQEYEIETWLEDQGVEDAWELAPTLVNIGYNYSALSELAENFTSEEFPIVAVLLCNMYTTRNLLEEIGQGTGRITEIVKALKSYTYLDQAPVQSVDIHEGLNDTLVMLRSKLKAGVQVRREYAPDLPRIEAFGSELNQVWTNIIDNAVSAMEGQGEIVLRTYRHDAWVVVEIKDTGPGIPPDIQAKIFDPFFTTKAPGEGTGLGLNISHNIIVQKHKGKIAVNSRPGETCFEIKLPLNFEDPQ